MALRSELVDCYWHNHVDDEPVDTEGLPVDETFFTLQVPSAIEHEAGASDERLKSPGSNHGRSYEVNINTPEFWQDRYGNYFSTLISKGNNFSRPDVMRSLTAPSGYIPYGLQEGDAILRVLRASRLMREATVDTEWIVRVTEPKVLYFEGEPLDPAEYKKRLLAKLIGRKMMVEDNGSDDVDDRYDDEELGTIASELKRMDFFITLRALAINERALDVLTDWKALNLAVIEKIFETYNRLADKRAEDIEALDLPRKLWLGTKPLSEFTDLSQVFDQNEVMIRNANIDSYCTFVLPSLLGMNMAKMHNNGLVHRFPTLTNVTSLGGIVDLDSVSGEPLNLGDEPITIEEMAEDVNYMFDDDHNRELLLYFTAALDHIYAFTKPDVTQNTYAHRFKNNLLKSYLQYREWGQEDEALENTLEFLFELAMLEKWDNYSMHYAAELTDPYVGELFSNFAKEYIDNNPVNLDTKELAAAMYQMFIAGYAKHGLVIDVRNTDIDFSVSEVREAVEKWLYEEDEEGVVLKDKFGQQLMEYLNVVVLEGMQHPLEDLLKEARERLKNTPLEKIDESLLRFIFYSSIHRVVHDYVVSLELPGHNETNDLMVEHFIDEIPKIREKAVETLQSI